ncbi:MAG: methionyl-tRNA formyltransferase [Clostridiales bacterium]|nr:methionyl-tRNA formyltransferase [Candidatus Apopatousia equi]
MKIIFLGTPHFAENVLRKLLESKHEVVAVVCQPDKPVGRKQILEKPPVKILAEEHNIPVYQFKKIRLEGVEVLSQLGADIMITAAYGQMLSQEVLDITKYGVINVHGSVLPRYRGSSPIQWSLINGEKTLGVTILQTHIGMDDGPILHTSEFDIMEDDTVESLMEKISLLGADLLIKSLEEIENGTAVFVDQDESKATKCTMLKKENAKIDFNKSALEIENFVRGNAEWPVAYTFIDNLMLKVYKAKRIKEDEFNTFDDMLKEKISSSKNGEVVLSTAKKGIIIKTEGGAIRLLEVQLEGGKKMDAKSFANGNKLKEGMIL